MAYRKGYTPKRRKLWKPKFRGTYKEHKFEGPPVDEYLDERDSTIVNRNNWRSDHCYEHAYGWEVVVYEDYYFHGDTEDEWKFKVERIVERIAPTFENPTLPTEFGMECVTASPDKEEMPPKKGVCEDQDTDAITLRTVADIGKELSKYGEIEFIRKYRIVQNLPCFTLPFEELGSLEALRPFTRSDEGKEFAARVLIAAPFWVRRPEEWTGEGPGSLTRHLFGIYEIPPCLLKYAQWGDRDISFSKWFSWLIIRGHGGSLKKAAKHFHNWAIPKSMIAALFEAPEAWSGESVSLFAEVLSCGGNSTEYGRISRHRYFQTDYTDKYCSDENGPFLRATVQWMVKHREEIDDAVAQLILEWAIHRKTELERVANRDQNTGKANFWSGRSLARVIERAREYEAEQSRAFGNNNPTSWKEWGWSIDYSDELEVAEKAPVWSFVEITDSSTLSEEGQQMGHCVGSYLGRCVRGESIIVSLWKTGYRLLTIEIAGTGRGIVQVHGEGNRTATLDEMTVVNHWYDSEVLEGA